MNPSSLETRCAACGQVHPISAGQFPPGVLDLLRWDGGLIWTRELIDRLMTFAEPLNYPGAHADFQSALSTNEGFENARKIGRPFSTLVVGSLSPWIEAIFIVHGCLNRDVLEYCPVVTTNIFPIKIGDDVFCKGIPLIKYLPADLAYAQKYDLVINYSGLEHFGLGRYGDPVDHDADKKWMRMIRDCIAPGGRLLLAVPLAMVGKTVGWKMKFVNDIRRPFICPQGRQDWQNQPLLELTPI